MEVIALYRAKFAQEILEFSFFENDTRGSFQKRYQAFEEMTFERFQERCWNIGKTLFLTTSSVTCSVLGACMVALTCYSGKLESGMQKERTSVNVVVILNTVPRAVINLTLGDILELTSTAVLGPF